MLATQFRTASSWWRHQMETFSALLAICAGNSPVPGEFPTQRPVTQNFDVFFDLWDAIVPIMTCYDVSSLFENRFLNALTNVGRTVPFVGCVIIWRAVEYQLEWRRSVLETWQMFQKHGHALQIRIDTYPKDGTLDRYMLPLHHLVHRWTPRHVSI